MFFPLENDSWSGFYFPGRPSALHTPCPFPARLQPITTRQGCAAALSARWRPTSTYTRSHLQFTALISPGQRQKQKKKDKPKQQREHNRDDSSSTRLLFCCSNWLTVIHRILIESILELTTLYCKLLCCIWCLHCLLWCFYSVKSKLPSNCWANQGLANVSSITFVADIGNLFAHLLGN